jgi:Tol biopolymer transport system component
MTKDARAATQSGQRQAVSPRAYRRGAARQAAASTLGMVACALLMAARPAAADEPVFIELISQTARGFSAEGRSLGPAVNDDGEFVGFNSNALNLLSPPLPNHVPQVYRRDLGIEVTRLISISPSDQAGNAPSSATGNFPSGFAPGISADGRFVTFSSRATNLVPDDTNGFEDVFVYDTAADAMELITRGIDGPANGVSTFPRLSADARFVVFQSNASNLVENDENEQTDIFLFDRSNGGLIRVSTTASGEAANGISITPAISADGRIIAFISEATNLIEGNTRGIPQAFVKVLDSGAVELISVGISGTPGNAASFLPVTTANGVQIAFKSEAFNLVPNDTNGVPDVFVFNRDTDVMQRVSVDSFGNQSDGLSGGPGISAAGRFVAFGSFASNFVPDDGNGFSDVYVYDRFPPGRNQGLIARVTVAMGGLEPNEGVPDFPVAISADGRWIGFASAASNLVPNDINNEFDVFLACNPFDPTTCAPLLTPTPTPTPTPGERPCVGDCNGDGVVTIDDLIRMVAIALGLRSICGEDGGMGQCLAGDANCDCEITVDEIIRAVNNSLNGCTDFGDCTLAEHAELCCGGMLNTPTPTPTPMMCSTKIPCPPGEACVDDRCATFTPTGTPTATPTMDGPAGPCVGDCNGNNVVTIDELVRMVSIALGLQTLCPNGTPGCLAGDATCDCTITVDDIIKAVLNSLNGCTIFNTCSLAEHEAECCDL